jgi:hypothetical protein
MPPGDSTDSDPAEAPAWLRVECGDIAGRLSPQEGTSLRDQLRSHPDDPAALRLAALVDSAVTALLSSPLHAGTQRVRVAPDERAQLLEAVRILAVDPLGHFARFRRDLER